MPSPANAGRHQTAVVWEPGPWDDYRQGPGEPREIAVRWEDSIRAAVAKSGETIGLQAMAWTLERIPVDSRMWLGRLADWVGSGSAVGGRDDELMVVATSERIPDEKGREDEYELGLQRFRDDPVS